MTYEELEILIKNRRTSERRAELVRTIPSEKEEAEGNNEHRQLELKKTTGEPERRHAFGLCLSEHRRRMAH